MHKISMKVTIACHLLCAVLKDEKWSRAHTIARHAPDEQRCANERQKGSERFLLAILSHMMQYAAQNINNTQFGDIFGRMSKTAHKHTTPSVCFNFSCDGRTQASLQLALHCWPSCQTLCCLLVLFGQLWMCRHCIFSSETFRVVRSQMAIPDIYGPLVPQRRASNKQDSSIEHSQIWRELDCSCTSESATLLLTSTGI